MVLQSTQCRQPCLLLHCINRVVLQSTLSHLRSGSETIDVAPRTAILMMLKCLLLMPISQWHKQKPFLKRSLILQKHPRSPHHFSFGHCARLTLPHHHHHPPQSETTDKKRTPVPFIQGEGAKKPKNESDSTIVEKKLHRCSHCQIELPPSKLFIEADDPTFDWCGSLPLTCLATCSAPNVR